MKNKYKFSLILFITLYSCVPSAFISSINSASIDKGSAIYISKFDNYSIGQKVFRNKLKHALMKREYFVVDDFQKSKYYLIATFLNGSDLKKDKEQESDNFTIDLLLIESEYVKNHLNISYDEQAIWNCEMKIAWMDYLEYQDILIGIIAKQFMNTYYGKKLLI